MANVQALLQKVQALPAERITEVEDFVDFLHAREGERALVRTATIASVPTFSAIWSNPDDDIYDTL